MVNPQPDEFAERITWRPDQGEHPTTIDGRLVRVSPVEGAFGRYPLLELEPDDGPAWVVHALRSVLQDELRDLAPQIGDRIQISYGGKTDNGRGYFSYRVRFADGSPRRVDWSRFGGDLVGEEPTLMENRSSITTSPRRPCRRSSPSRRSSLSSCRRADPKARSRRQSPLLNGGRDGQQQP
jgi:hypothetical protein